MALPGRPAPSSSPSTDLPMTRLRCAILDDYLNLALRVADWSKVRDRVDVTDFNEPFASQEAAAGALNLEAAKDHQVVLCGTQWGRDPTAPLTIGLILELTRNIGRENARMHAGERLQKFAGSEIEGRTLGVVGLGKLGSKVSGLAKAFGMNVIAWSPNLTPER